MLKPQNFAPTIHSQDPEKVGFPTGGSSQSNGVVVEFSSIRGLFAQLPKQQTPLDATFFTFSSVGLNFLVAPNGVPSFISGMPLKGSGSSPGDSSHPQDYGIDSPAEWEGGLVAQPSVLS